MGVCRRLGCGLRNELGLEVGSGHAYLQYPELLDILVTVVQ